MTQQLQQLLQLLNQAHALLDQALDHPQYQRLLKRGFTPENTIFNAQRLIVSLELEIKDFTQKSMVEPEEPKDRTIELIKLLVWFMEETNRAKKADSN